MQPRTDLVFQKEWNALVSRLEQRFGEEIDIDGILYLIGIQELGQGPQTLNKTQKVDLLHMVVCRLLEPYGYYEFLGTDEDGWSHYEATEQLPYLQPAQQHRLIKEAILDYFREMEL